MSLLQSSWHQWYHASMLFILRSYHDCVLIVSHRLHHNRWSGTTRRTLMLHLAPNYRHMLPYQHHLKLPNVATSLMVLATIVLKANVCVCDSPLLASMLFVVNQSHVFFNSWLLSWSFLFVQSYRCQWCSTTYVPALLHHRRQLQLWLTLFLPSIEMTYFDDQPRYYCIFASQRNQSQTCQSKIMTASHPNQTFAAECELPINLPDLDLILVDAMIAYNPVCHVSFACAHMLIIVVSV